MTDVSHDPLAAGRALKALLRGDAPVLGVFTKAASPDLVEAIALAGAQFVVADAEHGSLGINDCQELARAADAAGIPLLVRVPDPQDRIGVGRHLDLGPAGIVLPRVSTPAAANAAYAALFHPPVGQRGLAGARWARPRAGTPPLPELVAALPDALVVVSQIEDTTAVDHLDELLALPEPDVFFVGPTDMSASIGLRGDRTDPRARELVESTLGRIVAAGRVAGVMASSPAEVAAAARLGVGMITVNAESPLAWGLALAADAMRGAA